MNMDVSNVTCLLVAVSYSVLSMCCSEKLNTECKQKLCLFTKKIPHGTFNSFSQTSFLCELVSDWWQRGVGGVS